MREAVIVAATRTALAKSFRGSLNQTRPDDLAAHCIRHVLAPLPQFDAAEIEDVILGCGFPEGPQGMNVARIAALKAGLPASVAAVTVNRFCSSGLQAVALAAHQIIHEGAEAVVAGGTESITLVPRRPDPNPWVQAHAPGVYMVMGATAENVARRYGVSRQAQDEYALVSQQRTARAQKEGVLRQEIAPMPVVRAILDKQTGQPARQEEVVFDTDECNRSDTTLDGLAALKPHFDPQNGTVTAGNASQLADGAAALLLLSRQRAEQLGVRPLAVFRGFAVAGCEPDEMGIGPIFAVPKLLRRHGLGVGDIDLWELNEAFAVQVLYCRDRLGIDPDRLNVNGGSIALGHPYGMTGARLTGALVREMQRRRVRYGVVTMCVGGGQGAAGLFELGDG